MRWHQNIERDLEHTPGDTERQESLECCSP